MIIGKQVDNLNTPMIYKSPFQSLVDITNNLIYGEHDIGFWANKNTGQTGKAWDLSILNFKDSLSYKGDLVDAEAEPPEYNKGGLIWDSGDIFESGFTKLGVQAQFSTWLSEYETAFGNYGLVLELTFKCLELAENNEFVNYVTFDSDSFFGDVYNFETYYTQEAVFDIGDFVDYPIVRMRLYAYQRNNFRDYSGNYIYTNEDVSDDSFSNINPNIFIKDPYVCLGISVDEFNMDTAQLLTENSLTYYKGAANSSAEELETRKAANLKTVGLRWVHKDTEKDIIKTIQPDEIPVDYEIRWYRHVLGAPSPDQFAGAHWARFYGCKDAADEFGDWCLKIEEIDNKDVFDIATNQLEIFFQPNVNFQTEEIRAIIVKNEGTEQEPILRKVASSDILTFSNMDEVRNKTTVIESNTLGIKIMDDERGNYFIYNRAGKVGKSEDKEVRTLQAVFDPTTKDLYEKADLVGPITSIKWTFPTEEEGTMIIPATDTSEDAVPSSSNVFSSGDGISPEELTKVGFFIKPDLNRSATHNTVYLEVQKDGQLYTAQANLLFGTAGTSGSDFTLVLQWENGENALNLSEKKSLPYNTPEGESETPSTQSALAGRVFLLDQNGNLADIQSDAYYDFSWYKINFADKNEGKAYRKKEENVELKYPLQNAFLESLIWADPDEEATPYLIKADTTRVKYIYDATNHEFRISSEANGIFYQTLKENATRLDKIEFRAFDRVYSPDEQLPQDRKRGEIWTDEGILNGKTVSRRNYAYDNIKRAFIKYDNLFIIDPWEEFSDIEEYYEPVLTEEYDYFETLLVCEKDSNIKGRFVLHGNPNPNSLYILEVSLNDFGDYPLVARYPIPFKNGELYENFEHVIHNEETGEDETVTTTMKTFSVDYIEGPTEVRYSTSGELDFNKSNYQITFREYDKDSQQMKIKKQGYPDTKKYNNENVESGIFGRWRLVGTTLNSENESLVDQFALPSLIETTNSNSTAQYEAPRLNPSGIYFKDIPLYGVQFGISRGEENWIPLWTQPIYVYQDNYPSTSLNRWNGKDIKTDNDNGTIIANGFAAGKKERDNTFTGVALGDWSRTDTDSFVTQQTGVYGFNHGAMSYALKDDGTAFLGKDGKGRIYLSGNKAQIYSANWLLNNNGMLLDIDDGYIHMTQLEGGSTFNFYNQQDYLDFLHDTTLFDRSKHSLYIYRPYSIIDSTSIPSGRSIYHPSFLNNPNGYNLYAMLGENGTIPEGYYTKTVSETDASEQIEDGKSEKFLGATGDGEFQILEKYSQITRITQQNQNQEQSTDTTEDGQSTDTTGQEQPTDTTEQGQSANTTEQGQSTDTIEYVTKYRVCTYKIASGTVQKGVRYYFPSSMVEENDLTIISKPNVYYKNNTSPELYKLIPDTQLDSYTVDPNATYYTVAKNSSVGEQTIQSSNGIVKKPLFGKYITLGANEKVYPLAIGMKKSAASRPFKVRWDGTAFIEDGYFTGIITAKGGSIQGDLDVYGTLYGGVFRGGEMYTSYLEADLGILGGWEIGKGNLQSPDGQTILYAEGNPVNIETNYIKVRDKKNPDTIYGYLGYTAGSSITFDPTTGQQTDSSTTDGIGLRTVSKDVPAFLQSEAGNVGVKAGKGLYMQGGYTDAGAKGTFQINENGNIWITAQQINFRTPSYTDQSGIYAQFG